MDAYDADDYKQWIRTLLERLTSALESQIRTILTYRFHPRVVLLDTEVFWDGFRDAIPMRMFLMAADNCEAFHDDPAYFLASSIGILEEVKEVIPHSEEERQQRFIDAGIDTLEIEAATLVEWFADCWARAGGRECRLPSYICYHDDNQSFDLRQMKWEPDAQGKWTYFVQD
jgi:hypothetical protein